MRLLASSNTSAIEPAGLSSAARGSKPSMDGACMLTLIPLETAIVQLLGEQFQSTTLFEDFSEPRDTDSIASGKATWWAASDNCGCARSKPLYRVARLSLTAVTAVTDNGAPFGTLPRRG